MSEGEKSDLIPCFSCRPERTDTAGCGGKIKEWCLNCVVSESRCFHSGFAKLGAQRRC